jgi:hypothetical protein
MVNGLRVMTIKTWLGCWPGEIWTYLTFRHKLGFWWNFVMTSPETLYMKNAVIDHSFPLVTYTAYSNTRFGRYGFLKSGYGAELILDRTDRWVNFSCLRNKKRESWWGLFTDYIDHLTSFPALIHTHIFGNHSNGYGHLKQPTCGVSWIAGNPILQRLRNLDSISKTTRIVIFNVDMLLSRLSSLMICTHNLYVLTKRKRNDPLLQIIQIRWPRRSR